MAKKGETTSESTRAKQRESAIARGISPSTRLKMNASMKGRKGSPRSQSTRDKISASNMGKVGSNKGKKFSKTHCDNIAKSLTGNTNGKGVIFTIERCEKISKSLKGKPNHREGIKQSVDTIEKRRQKLIGKKHPSISGDKHYGWKGGISFGKYCPKFNRYFKERVRKFFDHTCQICGHVWQPGEKKLSIHHVYYNKKSCCFETEDGHYIHTLSEGIKIKVNGDPNKFVPLCSGRCHSKTNFNRLEWALYFEQLINNKFGGKSFDFIPNDQL